MIIDWQKEFDPTVLDLGFTDYQEGVVTGLKKRAYGFEASVAQGKLETVEIHVKGAVIEKLVCTCDAAKKDGYCRHMAAVLLTMDEMLPSPLTFDIVEEETVNVTVTLPKSEWSRWQKLAQAAGVTIESLIAAELKKH